MKTSIVTPTWNRAASLERMLASVEAQHPLPLEHIIVDNRSTDHTRAVVEAYAARAPFRVLHINEGDTGIYDAMNQGSRAATGDALYFLNDDDCLATPASLSLLARALTSTGADFVFADVIVVDPESGSTKRRFHRQVNELTLAEKSICQQATLYSRRILDSVGPFDATLRAAADYDWILKAFLVHNAHATYLRHPVARFHLGGLSSSPAHRDAFEAEMQAVRLRYYDASTLAAAKRYRRTWRKFPWGDKLSPNPARRPVRISSRLTAAGHLLPNPLAWLGF